MRRALACLIAVLFALSASAQDRETKVRGDRSRAESDGFWIYNDLTSGIESAKKAGKPLLVVFRCIPCEHCAQLDEKVFERDKKVQALMSRFVCVRIVHANGMDLNQFQFDYDQSWAAFLMNPDMTIYGRYGTRSHQTESENDVSLEGFAKALAGALELHRQYPQNKPRLLAKTGLPSQYPVPEKLPKLKGRFGSKLDYEGKVVQSCIHCHQVGEALRHVYRSTGEPIPDEVLYPYPHPKSLGLILDPKERAKVTAVARNSLAEKSGFQAGDEILAMAGQPILSIADIQWVLHHTGETAIIGTKILRGDKTVPVNLKLEKGWRQLDDISWRATSWELRRMVTGGLVFEDLPDAEREAAGLADNELALRIKHVGQFGAHAAGKKAGFQKGDVVIAVDGNSERLNDSKLLARLVNEKKPGDQVTMTVLRGLEKLTLKLPMQE